MCTMVYHNIIKQCVFLQSEYVQAVASHGYILGAHMNERTLLNNVMTMVVWLVQQFVL